MILPLMACSLFGGTNKLDVTLVDLQFEGVTLFETSANLQLRINNPNDTPVTIDGSTHEVYVNGLYLGRGTSDEMVTVPRLNSATQSVQVKLSNLSMIGKLQSLLESKGFDYSIESAFYVKGNLGRWKVTTKEAGELARNKDQ